MTYGCCCQTARYAEAYLALSELGMTLEARTPARAALEHAVTVEFAYLRTGGLDMLAASSAWASWSIDDRLARWRGGEVPVKPGPETGKRLPSVSGANGILDTLDPDNRMLQPGYTVLSQSVHVTNETVVAYFTKSPEDGSLSLSARREDPLSEHTRVLVAQACMFTAWIYARTRGDQARLDELDALAVELHLPYRVDLEWDEELRAHLD